MLTNITMAPTEIRARFNIDWISIARISLILFFILGVMKLQAKQCMLS
jgi:hypothetical protein